MHIERNLINTLKGQAFIKHQSFIVVYISFIKDE